MKVLAITGDKAFESGHPRFDLQANAVERFESLYVGSGSLWPTLPEGEFDVVTSQDPFFRGFVAWRISKKLGCRFNVQLHADLDGQGLIKKMIAPFILGKADSIRVVSEKLKQQVEKKGVNKPIFVLPVFVDLEPFRKVVRKPNEEPTLLWIGRFEDEKDPLLAIRVFKDVLEKIPNARMVMLGDGSLKEKIYEAAKKLPIEFPGWQNPVPHLEKVHVVFSTSKTESWGASIVEALAAGVPVVAPDVGIAKEAGAFVASRNELADKVVEALKSDLKGELKIKLLNKEEWLHRWKETLA